MLLLAADPARGESADVDVADLRPVLAICLERDGRTDPAKCVGYTLPKCLSLPTRRKGRRQVTHCVSLEYKLWNETLSTAAHEARERMLRMKDEHKARTYLYAYAASTTLFDKWREVECQMRILAAGYGGTNMIEQLGCAAELTAERILVLREFATR